MAQISGHKLNAADEKTGVTSEAVVLARLIELGYDVSLPFGSKLRYDLIVDDGRELLRAQVKTGRLAGSSIKFASSTHRAGCPSRSYVGDADVFLVYCPDNHSVFWVPVGESGESRRVILRVRESTHHNAQVHALRAWSYLLTETAATRRDRLEKVDQRAVAKTCPSRTGSSGPQVRLMGDEEAERLGLLVDEAPA